MPFLRRRSRSRRVTGSQSNSHSSNNTSTSTNSNNSAGGSQSNSSHSVNNHRRTLHSDIDTNLTTLKNIFHNCNDVVFREFVLAQREQLKLALIYVDGLTDKQQVGEQIMKALSLESAMATDNTLITRSNALQFVKTRGLCTQEVQETVEMDVVINAILSGDSVILVDGHAVALINGSRGWETRSIEDSKTETLVRGPRESFVETLRVNTSMLRRKIKNPNLKIEQLTLGTVTKTDLVLVYVKGIANEGLIEEAKKRISRIEIDGVLDTGYIEEFIRDNPYSIFPTLAHTDRPDRVAANLLEGRVAILVDGSPIALTAPHLFIESIQTPDDYYESAIFATAVRLLRIASLIIALTIPSLYVAIVSFHQEMLPTPLLLSIAAQREAVPFPVFVEALLMEVAFEVIREAGLRLPRPVGQAVSIVAALIIGQAAVEAGLVAGATIIVVALTAMASFTVYYSGSIALRLARFPLMFLSASLGLFGLISGIIVMVIHMVSLRSFGVPYLAPLAPAIAGDMKDSVVRAPWWALHKRPHLIAQQNQRRINPDLKPKPPQDK